MRLAFVVMVAMCAAATGCATVAKVKSPTNVAFAADNAEGMLVMAESVGVGYAYGRYRFVRVDLETQRVTGDLGMGVGPDRSNELFGHRPESAAVTTVFHYAIAAPGDYALIYLDSSVNNSVDTTERWRCLSEGAPIFHVSAGRIAVALAPDRVEYDVYRDNGIVRRNMLAKFPPGTSVAYFRSPEKAALDFAEVAATNMALTAPYAIAAPVGVMTFPAEGSQTLEHCQPGQGLRITLAR